jgi:hypothetical protein
VGPLDLAILLLLVGSPVAAVLLVARALSRRMCPRCGKLIARRRPGCPHCDLAFRAPRH